MHSQKESIKFIEKSYKLYEQKMYQVAFGILHDSGLADADTFEEYRKKTKISNITVPFHSPVKRVKCANKDNGVTGISSVGMVIDMDKGLGLESINEEEGYDPKNIYYVSVNYKNGGNYIVREHALQGIHACDKEIENSNAYSCSEKGNLVIVFNRLVDTAEVESITVNETTYTVKD